MTRTAAGAGGMFAPAIATGMMVIAWPSTAQAAPGDTSTIQGSANATVIDPGRLVAREYLRFGNIARPLTAGSLTITPLGIVLPTGSMVAASAIPQDVNGRGPAEFDVYGKGYRAFVTHVSNSTTISNGTSAMQVGTFIGNFGVPRSVLDPSGYFRLKVGATLQVGANQPAGTYSGTFQVSVIYQ